MEQNKVELLPVSTGCVKVEHMNKYMKLQKDLSNLSDKLKCVTGSLKNQDYFKVGDYTCGNSNNTHYITLSGNSYELNIRSEVISFLAYSITNQMNKIISDMNELVIQV